jgi:hypothetical protein
MTTKKLTKEEIDLIEKEIEDYGRRIGYYLNELDIPLELKQDLVKILPDLEPEDIDKLVKTLEERLIDQKMLEEDPEYQKKIDEINKETLSQLQTILSAHK